MLRLGARIITPGVAARAGTAPGTWGCGLGASAAGRAAFSTGRRVLDGMWARFRPLLFMGVMREGVAGEALVIPGLHRLWSAYHHGLHQHDNGAH